MPYLSTCAKFGCSSYEVTLSAKPRHGGVDKNTANHRLIKLSHTDIVINISGWNCFSTGTTVLSSKLVLCLPKVLAFLLAWRGQARKLYIFFQPLSELLKLTFLFLQFIAEGSTKSYILYVTNHQGFQGIQRRFRNPQRGEKLSE